MGNFLEVKELKVENAESEVKDNGRVDELKIRNLKDMGVCTKT